MTSQEHNQQSDKPSVASESSQPASGPNNDNKPRIRDKWDKLEILLRPAAAFLAAMTVALIGWFGQQALSAAQDAETLRANDAQKEITRRTELSENYRLYTQLLTKREEAESALRKDMFSTILKEFFQVKNSDSGPANIAKRLLKLELLALNFGETLRLSPLFVELDKDSDALLLH